MKIKKILLSLMTITLFSLGTAQVQATVGIGIKLDNLDLTTDASDDIDNNGSVDSRKSYDDTATMPSIFIEKNFDAPFGNLAIGVSYIPFEADIDKRSVTQSSVKAKADGAATTGTNSAEGTVSDHFTIYIQPGVNVLSNTVYLNLGMAFADVEGKNNSISSTNITESKDLEGTVMGVGVKRVSDAGTFLKLEYTEIDYDQVSWVTSNSTKGMADLDSSAFSISLGKEF
tara:strand:+ start:461 stop:1147 length:687 start_codon:yes stop_codon:yes gene_type:complete